MRYDDTLETVLASDLSTSFGKQSAWRQLVDLIGRRRIGADSRALAVLRDIQHEVPTAVRAASARGLEWADPPSPLVRLFARDVVAVAAPILRTARLSSLEWTQMLAELGPEARGILRHRRDLGPQVERALATFGPHDFALSDGRSPEAIAAAETESVAQTEPSALPADWTHVPATVLPEIETSEPAVEENAAIVEDLPADNQVDEVKPGTFSTENGLEAVETVPVTVAEDAPAVQEAFSHAAEKAVEAESRGFDVAEAFAAEATAFAGDAAPVVHADPPASQMDLSRVAVAPAPEEDMSFVELALAAGFSVAAARQADSVTISHGRTDQSETVATVAEIQAVAGLSGGSQASDMLEHSETFAADDEDRALLGELLQDEVAPLEAMPHHEHEGPFQIADVVARIDAFWRNREATIAVSRAVSRADGFRFETDADGAIRWVDGVSRNPIVGISLELHNGWDVSRVDGVAAGAFRRRASFTNARLEVVGESDAAGAWLMSGVPVFEPLSGRFTGYRGTARRPRADERAEPLRPVPPVAPDSLRQLVHELRTPTNAIAGFAEMIESEILGPVPDGYRDRASTIRGQARDLLGAIDDLDLAARIESAALALSPVEVALRPMLSTICDDLAPLTALRGSWIALPVDNLGVLGDRRAIERLLSRLMATLVSASVEGERIGVRLAREADGLVAISIDRPRALAEYPGESLLGIDDEGDDVTLLGTGFALRLARNLARELGGSMVIEPESLTLRLPGSDELGVDQAHLN